MASKWLTKNAAPKPEVVHPDYPLLPSNVATYELQRIIYEEALHARRIAMQCGVKTPIIERFRAEP